MSKRIRLNVWFYEDAQVGLPTAFFYVTRFLVARGIEIIEYVASHDIVLTSISPNAPILSRSISQTIPGSAGLLLFTAQRDVAEIDAQHPSLALTKVNQIVILVVHELSTERATTPV